MVKVSKLAWFFICWFVNFFMWGVKFKDMFILFIRTVKSKDAFQIWCSFKKIGLKPWNVLIAFFNSLVISLMKQKKKTLIFTSKQESAVQVFEAWFLLYSQHIPNFCLLEWLMCSYVYHLYVSSMILFCFVIISSKENDDYWVQSGVTDIKKLIFTA